MRFKVGDAIKQTIHFAINGTSQKIIVRGHIYKMFEGNYYIDWIGNTNNILSVIIPIEDGDNVFEWETKWYRNKRLKQLGI